MKYFVSTVTALLMGATYAAPAIAQDEVNEDTIVLAEPTPTSLRVSQVVDMLNGELEGELNTVFTEEFLAAVPPSQLAALSQQLTEGFGKAIGLERLVEAEGKPTEIEVRLERAIAKGMIAIDPTKQNRIIGLRFTSFEPINDSVEKIVADLSALPGTVSAYFTEYYTDASIISINPDKQLAIGSTFKLYVLAALAKDIKQGYREWSDVVDLTEESFPSGQLQDWPKGAPVTLHTLASMMISISDNTATDQLIKIVGHDRIMQTLLESNHAQMELNNPFLTTRQLFLLKGGRKEQLDAYRKGTRFERSDILEKLDGATVDQSDINSAFANGPLALDVEWFASGQDLAKLYEYIAEIEEEAVWPILSINESITESARKGWSYVGYKGGSEPGVLNLTWLLRDEDGDPFVLSLGWNNPDAAVDESKLDLIAQRILSLPR